MPLAYRAITQGQQRVCFLPLLAPACTADSTQPIEHGERVREELRAINRNGCGSTGPRRFRDRGTS